MAHENLGVKSEKHAPAGGCVTRHVGTYHEGNPCSHRWQAAKRARAEKRIKYTDVNRVAQLRWKATEANLAKLKNFQALGKLGILKKRSYGGMRSATLKPFATVWWPWPNNAHHIIPRSTLARVLEQISKAAAPSDAEMFDVMVDGLLGEPYNLNDEPNMIMLPTRDSDAITMGLPRHLEGSGAGTRDHPKYSTAVYAQVGIRLAPHYDGLAASMKAKTHQDKENVPAVKSILVGISNATYEAIISLAAVARVAGEADVTLDSIASRLFR